MKIPKVKQLPSGNWHCYLRIGGQQISVTEATKERCEAKAMAYKAGLLEIKKHPENIQLRDAAMRFINERRYRLSPTTVEGYEKIVHTAFPDLMGKKLGDITQRAAQRAVDAECGRLSNRGKCYSPKTIKNSWGFVSSVLAANDIDITVTLPEIKQKPVQLPAPEEIFAAVKGSQVELPVLLAMWLSFSLSEIRGLTKSKSISSGQISVVETVVDVHGRPVRKEGGKEERRSRTLAIPKYIGELIDKVDGDVIVPLTKNQITRGFWRRLDDAGLPHIPFHALRHINASVMADLNVPEPIANDRGGWKSDYVRKRVYTHAFSSSRRAADAIIDDYFDKIVYENAHKTRKSQ